MPLGTSVIFSGGVWKWSIKVWLVVWETEATTSAAAMASGTTFYAEINGPNVGSQYDQVNVTGTVSLGGATLNPTLGFAPTTGQQFTIINNDGADAVTGTFAGLPEGTVFSIGTKTFQISYAGGTGNDVVLTMRERQQQVVKTADNLRQKDRGRVAYQLSQVVGRKHGGKARERIRDGQTALVACVLRNNRRCGRHRGLPWHCNGHA